MKKLLGNFAIISLLMAITGCAQDIGTSAPQPKMPENTPALQVEKPAEAPAPAEEAPPPAPEGTGE